LEECIQEVECRKRLVTSKHGLENNIKIDPIETDTEDMNCIRVPIMIGSNCGLRGRW
jgi:hypothetical protein